MGWAYVSYYFTDVLDRFRDYPTEVKIAAASVALSALTIILALILLWRKSHRRHKTAKRMQRLEKRFGEGVSYVLGSESSSTMTRDEIAQALDIVDDLAQKKPLLKNKREKRLFAVMIYRKRIGVDAAQGRRANLHLMLEFFGMREFLENEVSLGNTQQKVDAIQLMRTFKLYISPWVINKLLNSKSKRVHRLAMYASVMSSRDSDLEYFETDFFDSNCCIYDEIELGYVLQRRRISGHKLPNLAAWAYQQENPQTQCVFVRLMRRFDQKEYCFMLVDLFQRSNHKKLIEEVARTWGYLHYVDGEKMLVDTLLMQPDDTKVAIMHAITRMDTGKSLEVLVDGFLNTGNPHVRFEALRCLYNYGEAGRAKFLEMEQKADEETNRFFSFFHNPITLAKIRLDKEQAYHPSVETLYNWKY